MPWRTPAGAEQSHDSKRLTRPQPTFPAGGKPVHNPVAPPGMRRRARGGARCAADGVVDGDRAARVGATGCRQVFPRRPWIDPGAYPGPRRGRGRGPSRRESPDDGEADARLASARSAPPGESEAQASLHPRHPAGSSGSSASGDRRRGGSVAKGALRAIFLAVANPARGMGAAKSRWPRRFVAQSNARKIIDVSQCKRNVKLSGSHRDRWRARAWRSDGSRLAPSGDAA